jgi:hypothetical protein
MKINENNNRTSNHSRSIIRSALLVGGLAFAAGFIGPILFSGSNLGPLLGIFVTGPIGTLAGAIWGIVRLSKNADVDDMRALLKKLLAVWGLTMLYTLFMISLGTQGAFPAICLQGLIVVSGIFLLYHGNTDTRLSESVKRSRPVILIMLVLVMLVTLFPPVTKPEWVHKSVKESTDSTAPLPKIAFLLDKRFDASQNFPLFAVSRKLLLLEWVLLAMVALAISKGMIWQHSRNSLGADRRELSETKPL